MISDACASHDVPVPCTTALLTEFGATKRKYKETVSPEGKIQEYTNRREPEPRSLTALPKSTQNYFFLDALRILTFGVDAFFVPLAVPRDFGVTWALLHPATTHING